MAWIATHPDNTKDVRVPDEEGAPVFTVGYFPPAVSERIGAKWQKARKPDKTLDQIEDMDEVVRQVALDYAVIREMARYGVRGWKVEEGGIGPKLDTERIDGRDHPVLSDESVEVLYRNKLLLAVAMEAMAFNVLPEEKKSTSS